MQTDWNPKWLAFLSEKGLTTQQADEMERPERISLNADFLCWVMKNMTPERKKHFFG
jgi:hypothetical protein